MPNIAKNKNASFLKTLLGAHTSIQGGIENALYEGKALSCTCIQMFTHSNRQWSMKPLDEATQDRFQQAREATGINQIAVHASYLVNLGSLDAKISHLSRITMQRELERCELLKIPFLIIHPGSAVQNSVENCIERIAHALESIFDQVPHKHTQLLLENMAGQGSVVGSSFEQLAAIKHHVSSSHRNRIGFCIDFCHAFAAGYSFTTDATYKSFWAHCDDVLGMKNIHAFHMNDSLRNFGSKIDRHTHIGMGKIGIEFFQLIMNDARFINVLKILETPLDAQGDHASNLAMLRSLIRI